MESIKELKKICEKKHAKGVSKPSLYAKYFIRNISIYVTREFLKTDITANQVTVLQTVVNLVGAGIIAFSDVWLTLLGVLLLQLGYVLDNVDGEVARYRKSFNVNGLYIDLVNHLVCIPAMYLGMGLRYYFQGHGLLFLVLGILGFVCKLSPSKRARWSTIEYMTNKWQTPAYNFHNLKGKHEGKSNGKDVKSTAGSKKDSAKRVKKIISGYPSSMNLYCVMLLTEIFGGPQITIWLLTLFIAIGAMEIVWE
ncbi:MAG: hypothetical protein LWX51_16820, partial [Deltaproteobacteria bacterium]|nr:hypothetical protein [Deltaproteobacteria bacterium]